MCKKFRIPIILLLLSLPLVFSCGDMDYIISTGQTYNVNGRVNGLTLDECGIIANDNRIIPYFDCNISGDLDVTGLTIILKNNYAKEVGFKLKYALPPKPKVDETDTQGETADENAEAAPQDSGSSETGSASVDETGGATEDTAGENVPDETPKEQTEQESDLTEETQPPEITDSSETADTGSDISDAIPETVISIKSLSESLPEFSFPKNIPPGFYTLVFQVNGNDNEILSSTEKPVFFVSDKQLRIEDLRDYLPGVSETVHVVPPETKIILGATVVSYSEFEPYLIWYNGSKIINEGAASNGFNSFMWQTPKQTGFQSIRAEIFPFNPNKTGFGIRGVVRNMSLPISLKHGRTGYFEAISKTLSNWYKLWGDTHDAFDVSLKEKDLVCNNEIINWTPYSLTYGLTIGAAGSYTLPLNLFTKIKLNDGSGQLLFRFVPTGNGTLAFLNLQCEENSWNITLSLEGNEITLYATVSGISRIIPDAIKLPLIYDKNGFVTAAVDFQFFENSNVIALSIENQGDFDDWIFIELGGKATGAGSVSFGNAEKNETAIYTKTNIAIITEMAFRYMDISPFRLQTEAEEAPSDTESEDLNPIDENDL